MICFYLLLGAFHFFNFFNGFAISMKFCVFNTSFDFLSKKICFGYISTFFKLWSHTRKKLRQKSKNLFSKCVLDLNFTPVTGSVFLIFSLKSQIRCTLIHTSTIALTSEGREGHLPYSTCQTLPTPSPPPPTWAEIPTYSLSCFHSTMHFLSG
jgi:hypothetical protein